MKRLIRAVLALALIAVSGAALALSADQTRTFPARLSSTQQVNYYRVTVNFNDKNISTAQQFGTLPAGSFIVDVKVEVVTGFNAGSTNVLTFGTTTNANELVASGDVTAATPAIYDVGRGLGRALTASGDTALYAKYTQTGSPASLGQAVLIIEYVPNNDQ